MTLGEALAIGTETLQHDRIASPRLTAEVLLAHCLVVDRVFLYAHGDDQLSEDSRQSYRSLIARRSTGEPLQYITRQQEFYGRSFVVGPEVLIPRPETELIIDAVQALNSWHAPRIVDVGTGSGCIAVTLSAEIAGCRVLACDVSLPALTLARKNVERLEEAVETVCMDLLGAARGPFEFIVSNPPYVAQDEKENLQREVRDWEPHVALYSDGDTLGFFKRLEEAASRYLVEGGYLVMEIGYSMEEAVRGLFGDGWDLRPTRTDLQGIPRVVIARKT